MLTFHEFPHAFVVMDGKQRLARARKRGAYGWLCRLDRGCWIDPRARQQGISGKYPELLLVKTKREARKVMLGIYQQGIIK